MDTPTVRDFAAEALAALTASYTTTLPEGERIDAAREYRRVLQAAWRDGVLVDVAALDTAAFRAAREARIRAALPAAG